MRQNLPDTDFRDSEEVLKREHQIADAQGQLGIFFFNGLENEFRGSGVETVHKIGDALDSGIGALMLLTERLQTFVQGD